MAHRPRNPDKTMETTTSFDLNKAIQRWRDNLAQSPAFRDENLCELESHLRDSIVNLQANKLSAEESFLIARKRIGNTNALEVEFGRLNRKQVWLNRVLWMLIGIQIWAFVSGVSKAITQCALPFGFQNQKLHQGFGANEVAMPVAIYAVVLLGGLLASVALVRWIINKRGPMLGNWLVVRMDRRFTLIAACLGVCLLCFAAYAGSILSYVWTSKHLSGSDLGANSLYFSYANYFILMPIQVMAMPIATVLLARKQFRQRHQ